MGEQTQGQGQFQTQTQSQLRQDSSSTSITVTISTTATTTNATVATATINHALPTESELSNAPSQTNSTPSKIPFRPRKFRKLSPDPNNSQIVTVETPIPTLTTASSSKTTGRNNKIVQQRAPIVPRIFARSLSVEGEVEIALRYLRDADPLLAPLIDIHLPPTFDNFQAPFLALTRSILYQQLAYKAGTSIYTRFIALCGGEVGVLPETVLALSPQQLRQIGVSGRKASYLHDLARKYQNGILSDSAIVNMDDKSLFTMLTMVNGIGSWSVHMFMIFSLHRPDVLPNNDLGVRKGVQLLYNLEELPRPSQMDQLCEKWRPYRSIASWYMWRYLHQHQQEQHHDRHTSQPQLVDPISSMFNLGAACAWGH